MSLLRRKNFILCYTEMITKFSSGVPSLVHKAITRQVWKQDKRNRSPKLPRDIEESKWMVIIDDMRSFENTCFVMRVGRLSTRNVKNEKWVLVVQGMRLLSAHGTCPHDSSRASVSDELDSDDDSSCSLCASPLPSPSSSSSSSSSSSPSPPTGRGPTSSIAGFSTFSFLSLSASCCLSFSSSCSFFLRAFFSAACFFLFSRCN